MKALDPGSLLVVGITFLLFAYALFRHGLTDDLLLETGVFLVSIKLILMSHSNGKHIRHVEGQLESIQSALTRSALSEERRRAES